MTKVIYTLYGLNKNNGSSLGNTKLQLKPILCFFLVALPSSFPALSSYIKELVLHFFITDTYLKHLTLIFLFTSVSMFCFFFYLDVVSLSLSWVYITVRVERKK